MKKGIQTALFDEKVRVFPLKEMYLAISYLELYLVYEADIQLGWNQFTPK